MSGRCCGGGGSLGARRAAADGGQPSPMPIPAAEMWTVLTASGSDSGRNFQSKTRAEQFANTIGGSIAQKY